GDESGPWSLDATVPRGLESYFSNVRIPNLTPMSQPGTIAPGGRPNEGMRQSLPVLPPRGFGQTSRPDLWWITPLAVFLGLGTFIVYSTWAAFQNAHYWFGPYLSPFYSPELFGDSPHAWLRGKPDWIPGWLPWSPALLILWAPGGFRFTCYY